MKETKNIRSSSSKLRSIVYWVATLMIAAEMLMGGVWDILQLPYVIAIIKPLGYPPYFLYILGFWKIAGGIVLLAPRLPRLKEWAYAGSIFNYSSAVVSHLVVGNNLNMLLVPIILIGLTVVSWAFRPPDRYALTGPKT